MTISGQTISDLFLSRKYMKRGYVSPHSFRQLVSFRARPFVHWEEREIKKNNYFELQGYQDFGMEPS